MKLRFKAFVVHLFGSALIAALSAALVFLVWYPSPLSIAAGVVDIFLLLLAVDVVIGPCITFVVFNPKKKELKRDLTIVVALQLMALIYGLHTVFIARPAYLVFNADRFDMVYANDLSEEKRSQATNPEFRDLPIWGPQIVAARGPQDREARNKLLFDVLKGGDDLPLLPQYYISYPEAKDEARNKIRSLDELERYNKNQAEKVASLIGRYKQQDVGYLPLRGTQQDLTVIVRRDTAEVLSIENLRPWSF